MSEQLFDKYLFSGFDRQKEICQSRSAKYADTYRDCQWLWMKAVAKRLGAVIPQDAFMAIALAAYADQKYQRMQGGYDEDHGRDGTNYQTVCIECVKHVEVERQLAYRKAESAAQMVEKAVRNPFGDYVAQPPKAVDEVRETKVLQ
jgi:hypothetical protein